MATRINNPVTLSHEQAERAARLLADYATNQYASAPVVYQCTRDAQESQEIARYITERLWTWESKLCIRPERAGGEPMSRSYQVVEGGLSHYMVQRVGHGGIDEVCYARTQAEAANVCSALNAQEWAAQSAEAFEAMRNALTDTDRWLATEINVRTLSRRDARRQVEVVRRTRAALALADKVSK